MLLLLLCKGGKNVQNNLSNMMNLLKRNNLAYTDLQIFDSLNNLRTNNLEDNKLINDNYDNLHDLIKFTYFKGEGISIDSVSDVVVAALSIGVLGKLGKWI